MNASLLALSAILLGQALQVRDGLYDPFATFLLFAACVSCAAAFVPSLRGKGPPSGVVLAGGLLLQFFELFMHRPGSETALARGLGPSMEFHGALGVAMGAAVVVTFGARTWRAAFWVALAAQLFAAFWIIRATPEPFMDVWWAQQSGLSALLQGQSPFSSSFPDIYGGAAWYPPSMRSGSSVLVGYPYPPLTLLAELPSFLVAGDLRYANAVALALGGALIAGLSRTRTASLAALLLVFSPRIFYVLESGWTEPVVIFFFSATAFCAMRAIRLLPLALGLAAVSKQNMPLFVPLVPLLRDQLRALAGRRAILACALIGPALTVLAVLPDLDGFVRSAVSFPEQVPLRTDVLSFPALLANVLGFHSSTFATVLGFAAAAGAIVAMLLIAPRTAAGFAAGSAATFLAFFAFNKYAGCNYYVFVIAALCCAAAAQAEGEIDPLLAMT